MKGRPMPEEEKALRAHFKTFLTAWLEVGKGQSLTMKVVNDPRRGPIIGGLNKAWTPKDGEAA